VKKIVSLVCVLVMLVSILGSFSVVAASPVKGFQVSGTSFWMQAERACNEGMRDISAIDLVKEIKSDGIWEILWMLLQRLPGEIQGQPRQ